MVIFTYTDDELLLRRNGKAERSARQPALAVSPSLVVYTFSVLLGLASRSADSFHAAKLQFRATAPDGTLTLAGQPSRATQPVGLLSNSPLSADHDRSPWLAVDLIS